MTTPARYWRVSLRSFTQYDYAQVGIATLELRDASDVNLTPLATVTAGAGMTLLNAASYPLSNMGDGDPSTVCVLNWPTYRTTQNWRNFDYDFGAGNDVLVDYIFCRIDGASYNSNTLIPANEFDFIIYSSTDGITYTAQALVYRPIPAAGADHRFAATVASGYYPVPPRDNLGGSGGIYGIVSEDGVALPNRPVIVLERDTFYKVGYTTTDENGGYAFNGLNQNKEFMVMSVDPSGPPYKNALIWDRITPINALGNIAPQSAFWARRARDPNLGSVAAFDSYIDGAAFNFFRSGVLSTAERMYNNPVWYDGFDIEPSVPSGKDAGTALKFLRSGRTESYNAYGLALFHTTGLFTGVNAAGIPANYANLTFEYIFKAPTASESALIFVWSGRRDSDDGAAYGFNGSYGFYAMGSGPTLEVTSSVINVRIPLSTRNRSTVRCSAPVVAGAYYHVVVTYAENNEIKLFVDGVLEQTTAIPGAGRIFVHYRAATDTTNSRNEAWDYLYTTGFVNNSVRRLDALYIGGYGVAPGVTNAYQVSSQMPPGWGGAVGMVALYNRTFSDAEVVQLYDSYNNWDTHVVAPAQSGYMGEVEADNPLLYLRLNDLAAPPKIPAPLGVQAYTAAYNGSPGFGAVGFVSGTSAITTSNGGALVTGVYPGVTFTVECFVRPANISGTQRIWLTRVFNSSAPAFLSMVSGVLSLSIWDISGTTTTITFPSTLAVGVDYHIVVSYDPWDDKKARLYINGALVSEQTATAIPNNYDVYWTSIGANASSTGPSYSERFQGEIGEFAIYNYVLPAARVQAHYDARNA